MNQGDGHLRLLSIFHFFVVACIECVFFPFGIVLSRKAVKELYGIESAASASPADG